MINRRADIDGLRAVAVLSVLLFHAKFSAFAGGFVGVDVFFVISGFVITETVLRDIEGERFSFINFYAKRVRRIFPALIIVIFVAIAAGWFLLPPSSYAKLAKQAIAGAFFVSNFLFWNEAGYFDKAAELKPLLHLWSLGIEEQFYVVWPLAIFLVSRKRRALLTFLAVAIVASFSYCVYLTGVDHTAAFYSPLTRIWELSLGGLIAVVPTESKTAQVRSGIFVLGLIAIGVAVLTFKPSIPFPGYFAAIPTLGAAAIIWTGKNNPVARYTLAIRSIVYVGLISYPLYLWHWPILSFTWQTGWPVPRIALLTFSAVLAAATYELVEKHIQRRQPQIISKPLLAGMASVAAASLAIFAANGVYSRYPENVAVVLRALDYDYGPDARLYECWLVDERGRQNFPTECTSPNRPGGVLIMGDSHAARLYPGLKTAFESAPIWQITRSSCLPIGGRTLCNQTRDYALKIAAEQKPRYAILFAAWANYSPDWDESSKLGTALGNTIDQFFHTGTQVIVLGPAPRWKGDLPVVAQKAREQLGQIPLRNKSVENVISSVDQQIKTIAEHHGAKFISVNNLLCNDVGCLVYAPGEPSNLLSWDTGHLTTAGAKYVSNLIRPSIEPGDDDSTQSMITIPGALAEPLAAVENPPRPPAR